MPQQIARVLLTTVTSLAFVVIFSRPAHSQDKQVQQPSSAKSDSVQKSGGAAIDTTTRAAIDTAAVAAIDTAAIETHACSVVNSKEVKSKVSLSPRGQSVEVRGDSSFYKLIVQLPDSVVDVITRGGKQYFSCKIEK